MAKDGWEAPIFHHRVAADGVRAVLPLRIAPGTKVAPMASKFTFGQQLPIIVVLTMMLPFLLASCGFVAAFVLR